MARVTNDERIGQIALQYAIKLTLEHNLENGFRRPTKAELAHAAPALAEDLMISLEEATEFLYVIHRY